MQRGRQARERDASAEEVERRGQFHAREGDTGEKTAAADHGRQRHPGQQVDRREQQVDRRRHEEGTE